MVISKILTSKTREPEDVIDLGAPRRLPASRRPYTPNPRLYPGPQTRAGARCKRRRTSTAPPRPPPPPPPQRRAHRRPRRAPALPSARLYRPPPPRAAPPPLVPRAAWPPPPPPRALETASRVALRLASHRDAALAPLETARRRSPSGRRARPRRLVVTLPDAGDSRPARLCDLNTDSDASTPRPRPRPRVMAAPPRHSASPEDRSDGNDPLSAPSEYLAEFLSAIMQRQYAEALKYCRLILQYEPHNATARGFYPLLRHKLGLQRRASDSDEASRHSAAPPRDEELMSHSADESGSEGSCASQSSLSLDSASERSASGTGASASSSSARPSWPSDAGAGSDEPDDNGNAPAPPTVLLTPRTPHPHPRPDDVENDNAGGGGDHSTRLKGLRAQYACQIE